jgi:type IV pilus assembly protein PilQ
MCSGSRPKDEINAKEKLDLEAAAALQGLEPLRTQSFQLNYTKAAEVAEQLTATAVGSGGGSGGARLLSVRGSVISEARTNQLFVTDIASTLERVQELIGKLDVPARQVLIEARIVEASDTFGKSLGVKLGGSDLRAQMGGDGGYALGSGNRIAFGSSYGNAVASSGAGGTVDLTGNMVNLPAIGQGGTTRPRLHCRSSVLRPTVFSIWSCRRWRQTAKAKWYPAPGW